MQPHRRGHHGRSHARFVQRSMLLVTSVGAHSRSEHVGAFAVAGDLAVGENSPIKAVATVVSVGSRG